MSHKVSLAVIIIQLAGKYSGKKKAFFSEQITFHRDENNDYRSNNRFSISMLRSEPRLFVYLFLP